MGYTHYFPRMREITNEEWALIQAAATEVINQCQCAGVKLAYEFDAPKAEPYVSGTEIRFNGIGGEGHETFHVDRLSRDRYGRSDQSYPFGFDFCKTARKPYDVAVTAILTIMHHYARGGWDIGSDGTQEDWLEGLELAHLAIERAETKAGLRPDLECPIQEQDDAVQA